MIVIGQGHPAYAETGVFHGESYKRLAPPRNTKRQEHLRIQSTQSTVNRHSSQTKHQALSKGQPGRRITPTNTAAVHASTQQQPAIITLTQQVHDQILSANAAHQKLATCSKSSWLRSETRSCLPRLVVADIRNRRSKVRILSLPEEWHA